MSKATKIWLITAASLIVAGMIIFGGTMAVIKWDASKLLTNKYETNSHNISETFANISVNADTADILIVPSDDGSASVECYERENVKHSVSVKDGVLVIDTVDERKWYEHIDCHLSENNLDGQRFSFLQLEWQWNQLPKE